MSNFLRITLLSSLLFAAASASAQVSFREEEVAAGVAAWGKGLGDLDGDGSDDIVVAGGDLGANVAWRTAPDWAEHSIGSMAGGDDLQIADINADGALDVVVNGGPVVWYDNPLGAGGDPTLPWTAHSVPSSDKAHDLVVGDVDGNGLPDILTRGEFGPTSLFLQANGDWTRIALPNAPDGEGSALCDMDDDGRIDVVGNGYWLSQPDDPVAGDWQHHLVGDFPEGSSAACADVNQDGRLDLVLAASEVGSGSLSWFEAPEDRRGGQWARHDLDEVQDVHRIHLVDIDVNGALDIVFGEMHQSANKRVGVYYNDGAANFTLQVISSEGTHNVAVGDIDGDGDVDLMGANWNKQAPDVGALKVWRNLSQHSDCASERFDVLVFSRTLEFRHESIPTGIAAIRELGQSAGFDVVDTEDPAIFTEAGLAPFSVIVFLNPSGEILDAAQQEAFKTFVNEGGGFVGIHNPTAYVLEDWEWYDGLVAARYESELDGTMRIETIDKDHPSTAELPDEWTFEGEAYNFVPNPKENGVTVLLNLDEGSVSGGTMGADHPISWYHLYDGGRAFYTVLGADADDYAVPEFRSHIVGAIAWAADVDADAACADRGADEDPTTNGDDESSVDTDAQTEGDAPDTDDSSTTEDSASEPSQAEPDADIPRGNNDDEADPMHPDAGPTESDGGVELTDTARAMPPGDTATSDSSSVDDADCACGLARRRPSPLAAIALLALGIAPLRRRRR